MVERIRTLLETRLLTPTQFADLIGVARPIVSHILSGRNKPSLEVVQRILAALPELSMPWLLNGTGTMYYPAPALVPSPSSEDKILRLAPVPDTPIAEPIAAPVVPPPASTPAVPSVARAPQVSHLLPDDKARMYKVQRSPVTPKRFVTKAAEAETESVMPVSPPPAPIVEAVPEPPELPVQRLTLAAPSVNVLPPPAAGTVTNQNEPDTTIATALFAGPEKPIRRIVIFYRDGSFADYQPE